MNKIVMACLSMLLALPAATTRPASAQETTQSPAIGIMAGIAVRLDHYPDAEGMRQLKALEHDTASPDIRTLARALMRMRHTVQPEDAQALRRLMADDRASPQARELAGILLEMQHHATPAEKQRLRALIGNSR